MSDSPATVKRRSLRFNTIDEALLEATRLAAAERDGQLRQAGTWSLGKTLGHLATWANFALDGYPASVHPPLPVRIIAKLMRNSVINKGMPPGMRIGRVPGGTLGLDEMPTDEGLVRFNDALERIRRAAPTQPNPAFGPLTHEQWISLNLRHAELHLGFHVPVATKNSD
jgi:hypothetical protein